MLYRVIGPQDAGARAARTQTLRRDDVLIAAATLAEGIRDETWAATPGYLIPSDLAVGQYTVNAAEFLRMMAETLSGIAGSATRSPRLVAAEAMPVTADLYAGLEDAFFPGTIAWSLKPAALLPAE
ncbi:MAG: hypothetical protein HYV63_14025 [Candidatus Schekmanbacteria bacterium]|nr:hypothetical protein [Candidatus Schekmanbacteria bacterium]